MSSLIGELKTELCNFERGETKFFEILATMDY